MGKKVKQCEERWWWGRYLPLVCQRREGHSGPHKTVGEADRPNGHKDTYVIEWWRMP